MKLTNLTINDLITPKAKLTFLVGAGSSVDLPSCLPAGRAMMDAIIDYACAESEIERIKELEQIRFETFVEIIRDRLDPELKIIEYYGLCNTPNIQHFFLANMIKRAQFVVTTNFDFLIEYALLQLGVLKEEIIPVITSEDYQKYNDPKELFNQGKKTVYKIHGSMENIVTGKSTRDSLIATIQAFGQNKEGDNIFQLEPFKQPAFKNLTDNRSLVVIGYSGSDDFDIVPTLKVLEQLEDVIWINYIHDDGGREKIYEIENETSSNYEKLTKIDQILIDIKQMNYAKHVFRVDVNTPRMVNELLDFKPTLSSDYFSENLKDWFNKNINIKSATAPGVPLNMKQIHNKTPTQLMKYYIAHVIYIEYDLYDDAKRCLEEVYRIAEEKGDKGDEWSEFWRAKAIQLIGRIYYHKGDYTEALKRYQQAYNWLGDFGDFHGLIDCYIDIGMIHNIQRNYLKALQNLEEALNMAKLVGGVSRASCYNSIGLIYNNQGKYSEALENYKEALKITEQLGELKAKATCLNNIGTIYLDQKKYSNALENFEEALKITDQLGNLSGKATFLMNIGRIYYEQGNYSEALKRYEKALEINKRLGQLHEKAFCFRWIGAIYEKMKDTSKALSYLESTLEIYKKLRLENDIQLISKIISNLKSKKTFFH